MSASLRVALLLLAVCLLAWAFTGADIYARLTYVWLFLILGNALLARVALAGLEFRRRARTRRAQVGQVFEELFEVHNHARFPKLWLEVTDRSTLAGAQGSRVITLLGGRRTRNYFSRTRLIARGIYPLGPTRLVSGDLFGFFTASKEIPLKEYLTVLPKIVEIEALPNPYGFLPGGDAVNRRTPQITPNAAGTRDYVHGDQLSRIHWPSTVRRGRMIVKEFELDPLAEVWIFVDGEKASHVSKPHGWETDAGSVIFQRTGQDRLLPATEEYAATIAASAARYYLKAGRSVGLLATGEPAQLLPVDRGARQQGKILEAMAVYNANSASSFVSSVLTQARVLPSGSTAFVVTPSANTRIADLAVRLEKLSLRSIFILIDPLSFGGKLSSGGLAAKLASLDTPHILVEEGQALNQILSSLRTPGRRNPVRTVN
jgi:uncharacterized protein (DUF58 family)